MGQEVSGKCPYEQHERIQENVVQIVKEFDELPLVDVKKPRVGLVGEILVKFHPTANNQVVEVVESEGGEAVMPDLIDFFLIVSIMRNLKKSIMTERKKVNGSQKQELN